MIYAYQVAKGEETQTDVHKQVDGYELHGRTDADLGALRPYIMKNWMRKLFCRQKVPPKNLPAKPFPPKCLRLNRWLQGLPDIPKQYSPTDEEPLVYWDPSFKMSKEEAKEKWDELQKDYEEWKEEYKNSPE